MGNSNNPEQNKKRQNNWCDQRVGRNDILIKNKCKESCDNCKDDDDSGSSCHNHPKNWKDYKGKPCSYYSKDKKKCNSRDYRPGSKGKTPQQACCACGGGCKDFKYWEDDRGYGCKFYAGGTGTNRCDAGWQYRNDDGVDARDACCVCGGGRD